jgi:hypothetical protein
MYPSTGRVNKFLTDVRFNLLMPEKRVCPGIKARVFFFIGN